MVYVVLLFATVSGVALATNIDTPKNTAEDDSKLKEKTIEVGAKALIKQGLNSITKKIIGPFVDLVWPSKIGEDKAIEDPSSEEFKARMKGLASEYKVVFTEGASKFDSTLQLNDLRNKYLAKIEVYVDGELTASDIRGSTISNPIFYYQMCIVDGKEPLLSDENIENILNRCDKLSGMCKVIEPIVYVPVIWSGKYRFKIGQPNVLNLGGMENQPYNAKSKTNEEDLQKLKGFCVPTINKNREQEMNRITCGINIHRDSKRWLTIHPDDWDSFISKFPCIDEWEHRKHKGIVEVIRPTPQAIIPNQLIIVE